MTRLPDQVDAPMTPRQLATLRTLSAEAYQPKLFEKDLTSREAERRIAALRAEIELANSFCSTRSTGSMSRRNIAISWRACRPSGHHGTRFATCTR